MARQHCHRRPTDIQRLNREVFDFCRRLSITNILRAHVHMSIKDQDSVFKCVTSLLSVSLMNLGICKTDTELLHSSYYASLVETCQMLLNFIEIPPFQTKNIMTTYLNKHFYFF